MITILEKYYQPDIAAWDCVIRDIGSDGNSQGFCRISAPEDATDDELITAYGAL